MIKIENLCVSGWEAAIRGMRNPMNSWNKSDSTLDPFSMTVTDATIGKNDMELMFKLSDGGPVHGKFKRMIFVTMDITAPLYWWKEFDTYKVGTVANSCSTMHKIHAKEFVPEDFSMDKLYEGSKEFMDLVIMQLNMYRNAYLKSGSKMDWWQMIQLLPSSYNQKRTVALNYEVLTNIYHSRKSHKLDEWRKFCQYVSTLPMGDMITKEQHSSNLS